VVPHPELPADELEVQLLEPAVLARDVARSQAATIVDGALWEATCAAMGLNADVLGTFQGEGEAGSRDERTLKQRPFL